MVEGIYPGDPGGEKTSSDGAREGGLDPTGRLSYGFGVKGKVQSEIPEGNI